jgi:hypothetical protein
VVMAAVGGLDAVAAFLATAEAIAVHELGDAGSAMVTAFGAEAAENARAAVSAAAGGVDAGDVPGRSGRPQWHACRDGGDA